MDRQQLVAEIHTLALPRRAIAALFTVVSDGDRAWGRDGLDRLLSTCRELGVPEELLTATEIAATRTREPITVMVPLIWLVSSQSRDVRVCDCAVPPLTMANGVPLYALDEHTRLGREAIWRFACENDAVRACVERFVSTSQRRRAAYVAAFRTRPRATSSV